MLFLYCIIFGIVQGVTEFLPVSSSGHLTILSEIFGIDIDLVFFSILVHFATLLAVIIVLKKEVWKLLKKPLSKEMLYLIVATIPAGLAGVFLSDFIEGFFSINFVIFGLILTAVFLIICEYVHSKKKIVLYEKPALKTSLFMGFAQAFAIFPGISRSGSTITFGVISGLNKKEAANFSFLQSIPIILGSMLLEIIKLIKGGTIILSEQLLPVSIGFIMAFIFGILSIKFMLKLVKNKSFKPFVIYLFCLSIILLVYKFF